MKVQALEQKDNEATFVVDKMTPALANALRRLYVSEVPTLAVEDVEFRKNSSILYDETIAHRLGLLVLKTDLTSYSLPPENEEDRSAAHELKLTCSAVGPCTVYAEDLKSQDPKAKPVHGKTPIVKLLKDQELEFEATAILGKGRAHMKWAPGLMFYNYKPKDAEQKNIGSKWDDQYDLPLLKGTKQKTLSDGEFVFKVESWGQLSPKEGLVKATEIFDEKLDEFAALVK